MKLYARQEPTTDDLVKKFDPQTKKRDTVFYKDEKATEIYCLIPWHHKNRPISRKKVTLNCFCWDIVWI